jgi:methionyl-tRNA formyltransferase
LSDKSVLLLTSKGEEAQRITALCRRAFPGTFAYDGDWGDPLPEGVDYADWDYVFSYCSRWIVPKRVLDRTRIAAINFHPGSPDYPGIGCLNWALYEDAKTFGVTAHHITPQIDAGQIIEARLFDVLPADTVASLFDRTHTSLQSLAMDMISSIAAGNPIPQSDRKWGGKMRSRRELDALMDITPDMDSAEIGRRARATVFGKWSPAVTIGGHRFELSK